MRIRMTETVELLLDGGCKTTCRKGTVQKLKDEGLAARLVFDGKAEPLEEPKRKAKKKAKKKARKKKLAPVEAEAKGEVNDEN